MNWEETKNNITVLDNEEKAYVELLASLVAARINKGISQAELAEMTRLKQPAISRIENHNGAISMRTLLRIVNALDYEIAIKPKDNERSD